MAGLTSGGLTYVTFKQCTMRLQKSFREMPIANPSFYEDMAVKKEETSQNSDSKIQE